MTRRQIPRLGALLALVVLLALAPAAARATAPLGGLTPLPSPFGCYLTSASGACASAPDLDSVRDLALSPSANRNRSAKPCPRWVALRGHASRASAAGAQHVHVSGRLAGRALPLGSYRLTLVATNAAGHHSAPATTRFTIVR